MSCTEADASSLMAKIESLDLTDGEQSALEAVLDAATGGDMGDEVEVGRSSRAIFSHRPMMAIRAIRGDITELDVDAIVNRAGGSPRSRRWG